MQARAGMLECVGPEALSTREFARAVGVGNNAPQWHLASTQHLLGALARDGCGSVSATDYSSVPA